LKGTDMPTVAEYQGYLSELSRKLVATNVKATILLFGGGAMALELGVRSQTQDLDVALREGAGSIRLYASEISRMYDISDDWINDDGARFVTPRG
jgi:hypothetical protein